jgi:hypothetical protein
MTTRYCVTKQIQYPDSDRVVEVSVATFDYVNPDCLSDGIKECETATEAVEYAIELAQKWQAECGEEVFVGKGYTGGNTMPFDPWELCELTFAKFRAWARERDEDLLRCDWCGSVIEDQNKYSVYDSGDFSFCREYCAEQFIASEEEGLEEDLEYA